MAEFENFRKRTDKEKQAMFDTGAKSVIEKILPVVDNFERGLATVPEESKEDPFVDGMNRIYKQLRSSYGRRQAYRYRKCRRSKNNTFRSCIHKDR